jgi:hypothetical protein
MRARGGPLNEPHRPPVIIIGNFAIKAARNSRDAPNDLGS